MGKRIWSQWMQQMIFLGPAILVYLLIIALPFILSVYYSFTNWNGVSGEVAWVGLNNFKTIFTSDARYMDSFWFTARFAVVVLVLTNLMAFVIAYFLSKPLKSRNLLRTVFFVPNVLGGLLYGFIWQFIFTKGFKSIGELTHINFFSMPWLGTEETAFWALVIAFVWHQTGYLMVIYVAGIANVPRDIIEASIVDGASNWEKLVHITIPLIMPIVTVCLFLTISWAFKMFDLNYSLTKGGPYNSSESVALNIYTEAFINSRYGLGTAKAIIFFIVVALISFIQVSLTKRKEVDM